MEITRSGSSAGALGSARDVDQDAGSRQRWYALIVLAGGFIARCWQARSYFLNPDEALHNLLASQSSLGLTYRATLTTAHPPLLIIVLHYVLHYWRWLGQSELALRTPSLLAGTGCCWLMYLWLQKVTDRAAAFLGLLLFAFTPALIELSSEVRQYAFLIFFMAACLYLSERALQEKSLLLMGLFSVSLYGALLSHYSSLLFAASMGVYMLVRFYRADKRIGLFAVWAGGQVLAVGLIAYLFVSQVSRLKQSGLPQDIAGTWLRKSIYHPGESSLLAFPAKQTLWLFTYFFSHGLLGTLALLLFVAGIISLLRKRSSPQERPSTRELALLLGLPFVINCAVAVAGFYPFGGTRHNSYLALFALTGIAIGLSLWRPRQMWMRALVVILGLAACNLFPAPPPLIRARNHKITLMREAVAFIRHDAPPGSILFADYQSGLLLGYYACGHGVVQEFPPFEEFSKANCGAYTVITTTLQKWTSKPDELSNQLADAAKMYGLAPGTHVWLFNAGWILDSAPTLRKELPQLGCNTPQSFGENVQACELTIGGNRTP